MKKLIAILACVMMSMMMLVACGKDTDSDSKKEESKKEESNKNVTIDVVATADALIKDVKFVDQMSPIDSIDFFTALFSIDAADVKEQKTYTSTGATAEMLSAVKCTDADAAEKVKGIFEAYTKDLSSQYADYKPEECEKLDNPVIKVYNEYVIICVSDDNDTATKTIEGQVK